MPSALCGAGAHLPFAGIVFPVVWEAPLGLLPCPGPWSAQPCPCQAQLAGSQCLQGLLAQAGTASFHGHQHFPVLLQLPFSDFGTVLCELRAAPASAQAFQVVPSWEGRVSCLMATEFVPWQDPGAWGQKKKPHFPLNPNLVFSFLLLQGRAVKEPHTPRLEETQGCQD